MFKRIAFTALMVGLLGIGSTAHAGLITGGITFGGLVKVTKPTPGPATLGTAKALEFQSGFVLGGAGTYAGATVGTPVGWTDFTFNPLTLPATPLWTFTDGSTFSFMLTSLSIFSQNGTALVLKGLGIATMNGLDPTLMNFSLSTQAPAISTGIYSYSASTSAVPEPATLGLLGMGLLGLGARARRRRKE